MALRRLVPRVVVVVLVALLATATITFAASTRGGPVVRAEPGSTAPTILLVPEVRHQAYVFAKSTLEEGGFAWRVEGSVRGYAANLVASQSPAPGSRVYDTGAPTIELRLSVNPRYPQAGTPENASSFPGTAIRLVGVVAKRKVIPRAKPVAKPKRRAKPAAKKPKPKAKPARPPAFQVPGAKSEPLDEVPLTTRARALDAWLSSHRSPTDPNVGHWLYQHSWIVTGARFGWWHGAGALELLIKVDEHAQGLWGIGARSERVARAALAEVRRRSR